MKSIAKRHNIAKRQKKEKSFTKGTGKIEAVTDVLNRLSSASMARVAYTSSPPTATTFGSLSKDVSELRVIFVLISVMNTYVSTASISLAQTEFLQECTHLCRLSGLGYLCSRSGQNGHTYPGD